MLVLFTNRKWHTQYCAAVWVSVQLFIELSVPRLTNKASISSSSWSKSVINELHVISDVTSDDHARHSLMTTNNHFYLSPLPPPRPPPPSHLTHSLPAAVFPCTPLSLSSAAITVTNNVHTIPIMTSTNCNMQHTITVSK